jgi:hypothetical protein
LSYYESARAYCGEGSSWTWLYTTLEHVTKVTT